MPPPASGCSKARTPACKSSPMEPTDRATLWPLIERAVTRRRSNRSLPPCPLACSTVTSSSSITPPARRPAPPATPSPSPPTTTPCSGPAAEPARCAPPAPTASRDEPCASTATTPFWSRTGGPGEQAILQTTTDSSGPWSNGPSPGSPPKATGGSATEAWPATTSASPSEWPPSTFADWSTSAWTTTAPPGPSPHNPHPREARSVKEGPLQRPSPPGWPAKTSNTGASVRQRPDSHHEPMPQPPAQQRVLQQPPSSGSGEGRAHSPQHRAQPDAPRDRRDPVHHEGREHRDRAPLLAGVHRPGAGGELQPAAVEVARLGQVGDQADLAAARRAQTPVHVPAVVLAPVARVAGGLEIGRDSFQLEIPAPFAVGDDGQRVEVGEHRLPDILGRQPLDRAAADGGDEVAPLLGADAPLAHLLLVDGGQHGLDFRSRQPPGAGRERHGQ